MYSNLQRIDAELKDAEWRAIQGNPPFSAGSGPSDATPAELDAEAALYLAARACWINDQHDEATRLRGELESALTRQGIKRPWWDAYVEGWAKAPTSHAYYVAVHRDEIHQ
jgi:hypothetical protein